MCGRCPLREVFEREEKEEAQRWRQRTDAELAELLAKGGRFVWILEGQPIARRYDGTKDWAPYDLNTGPQLSCWGHEWDSSEDDVVDGGPEDEVEAKVLASGVGRLTVKVPPVYPIYPDRERGDPDEVGDGDYSPAWVVTVHREGRVEWMMRWRWFHALAGWNVAGHVTAQELDEMESAPRDSEDPEELASEVLRCFR